MATPGELISTMADALGLPEATLISHDRALLEAGLRSKSGRGRSAARVTPRDAATLLIAVLGSQHIKDTVATIKRYADSRPRAADSSAQGFASLGISELGALNPESSFVDAVEALISASANGALRKVGPLPEQKTETGTAEAVPLIEVTAQTPGTVGAIRIAGVGRGKTASVVYALPDPFELGAPPPSSAALKAWQAKVEKHRTRTDLSQQRRVTTHTITQLGTLLATDEENS